MTVRRTPWAMFSNHGHVLVCIAQDPNSRLRDISSIVGITERAVHSIIEDLEVAGILQRIKLGRRNQYLLDLDQPLTHSLLKGCTVGRLVGWLTHQAESTPVPDDAMAGHRP